MTFDEIADLNLTTRGEVEDHLRHAGEPKVAVIVEAIGKDGLVRADLEHVLPDWNRWRAAAAKEAA